MAADAPSRLLVRGWVAGLLVGALFLLVGAVWAVSSPAGSSPDDDFHLGSIWCAWGRGPDTCVVQGPGRNPGELAALVPAQVVGAPCFAFKPTDSGACSYQLPGGMAPSRANDTLYPGLFYAAMRIFAGPDVPRSVVLMRLANVTLAALLVALAVTVAPPLVRRAFVLSWLGVLVPLGLFVVASTNPSSWTLVGIATYWVFLLRWLDPPATGGSRTDVLAAVGAVAAGVLAAGSRADGAAYVVVATLAVTVLVLRRRRHGVVRYVLPAAVVVVAFIVFQRSGQSSALGGLGPPTGREGVSLLLANVVGLPGLLLGSWGQGWGLGWLDTPLSGSASGLAVGAAAGLVVLGVAAWWRRKGWAIAVVLAVLVALPLLVLQRAGNVVGENVQPRYLLPLVGLALGLVLLSLRPFGRGSWRLTPAQGLVIGAMVAGAQALALHDQLRRYVTGIDGSGLDLATGKEWWWNQPIGPNAVWLFGSLAGAALAAAVVLVSLAAQGAAEQLVRSTSMPSPEGSETGGDGGDGPTTSALGPTTADQSS